MSKMVLLFFCHKMQELVTGLGLLNFTVLPSIQGEADPPQQQRVRSVVLTAFQILPLLS